MQRPVSFRGQSGRTYVFTQVDAAGDWPNRQGVALFAAPEHYGWRVIRMSAVRGREHDVQPIWAQADAVRYGGDAVLFLETGCAARRKLILEDLEAGLNPLWPTVQAALELEAGAEMPVAA